MNTKMLNRIIERSKLPELLDALVNRLSLSDLVSFLLEVYRQRIAAISRKYLTDQYAKNRFVQPSPLDPKILLVFDQQRGNGMNYYSSLCFQIYEQNISEQNFLLVDGGFTDCTQQFLNNRKERLLISAIGSERLLSCFGI